MVIDNSRGVRDLAKLASERFASVEEVAVLALSGMVAFGIACIAWRARHTRLFHCRRAVVRIACNSLAGVTAEARKDYGLALPFRWCSHRCASESSRPAATLVPLFRRRLSRYFADFARTAEIAIAGCAEF